MLSSSEFSRLGVSALGMVLEGRGSCPGSATVTSSAPKFSVESVSTGNSFPISELEVSFDLYSCSSTLALMWSVWISAESVLIDSTEFVSTGSKAGGVQPSSVVCGDSKRSIRSVTCSVKLSSGMSDVHQLGRTPDSVNGCPATWESFSVSVAGVKFFSASKLSVSRRGSRSVYSIAEENSFEPVSNCGLESCLSTLPSEAW